MSKAIVIPHALGFATDAQIVRGQDGIKRLVDETGEQISAEAITNAIAVRRNQAGKTLAIKNQDGSDTYLPSTFNVLDYGADPTGVKDSTAAFKATAAAMRHPTDATLGGGEYSVPRGRYRINDYIDIPPYTNLFMEKGTRCIAVPGGGFSTTGDIVHMFRMNVNAAGTDWEAPFTRMGQITAENVWVENTIQPNLKVGGLLTGGAVQVTNLITRQLFSTHNRVGGYNDHLWLHGVICEDTMNPTDYQLKYGIGDGVNITNLSGGRFALGSALDKLAFISSTTGGLIDSAIWQGEIAFRDCRAFRLSSFHCERGRVLIHNSSINIMDGYFWRYYEVGVPTPRVTVSESSYGHAVTLRNVRFMGFYNLPQTINSDFVEVQVALSQSLEVENSFMSMSNNGGLAGNDDHGFRVNKQDGSPLTDWNEYCWLLSRKGRIRPRYNVEMNHIWPPNGSVGPTNAGKPSISNRTANNRVVWKIDSGQYYYTFQVIYDRTRMFGIDITPTLTNTLSLVNGGNGTWLTMSWVEGGIPSGGWIRVYRGTTNNLNSYIHFVDVPAVNVTGLFDDGLMVNGFPWQTRAAAPKDEVLSLLDGAFAEWQGRNVTLKNMASPPTFGIWKVGDRLETAPSVTGSSGWVCTVAGSPGTWKQLNTEVPGGAGATITSATAMPTTGSFVRGSLVLNSQPTVVGDKVITGWARLTTGSGHISGTDWTPLVSAIA